MTKLQSERIRAHKANLDRYCRLLATQLSDIERDYIHKRIAEQHAALAKIEAEAMASSRSEEAHPDTVIAAVAIAKKIDDHSGQ